MLDNICLWIGRVFLFGTSFILVLAFVFILVKYSWKKYFQYVWFKFKHLIPHWWGDEEWYKAYCNLIEEGLRPDNKISRKGQLARLYCAEYPIGTRVMFIWIKKSVDNPE